MNFAPRHGCLRKHGFEPTILASLATSQVLIFVLDLNWINWETTGDREQAAKAEPTTT